MYSLFVMRNVSAVVATQFVSKLSADDMRTHWAVHHPEHMETPLRSNVTYVPYMSDLEDIGSYIQRHRIAFAFGVFRLYRGPSLPCATVDKGCLSLRACIDLAKTITMSIPAETVGNIHRPTRPPHPSNSRTAPDVMIYILCATPEKLNAALCDFAPYAWARPVLMKYQSFEFENTAWRQLAEVAHEWETRDMVGTLSSSVIRKTDIDSIDRVIQSGSYKPNAFFHFMGSYHMPTDRYHPHLTKIINAACESLGISLGYEHYCNYWMCKPVLFNQFIHWYERECKPFLEHHPRIFENARYTSKNYTLDLRVWGKPYFPHYPFVSERINPLYFFTHHTIVFLLHHSHPNTGATIALNEVQRVYESNRIECISMFEHSPPDRQFNIVSYIERICCAKNKIPMVICNTHNNHKMIRDLSETSIRTLWYIHEWFEGGLHLPPTCCNVTPVFISDLQQTLMSCAPKRSLVIKNYIDFSCRQRNAPATIPSISADDLVIAMIGTVCERKNQQSFIERVFYRIADAFPQVKLLLVGKMCVRLTVRDPYQCRIVCIGEVTETLPYIHASDIVVSYSTNEVYPLNLMEAMHCNKPVVATNVGAVSEIVTPHTGYLIASNDADACFDSLSRLIQNPELRQSMGAAAHARIQAINQRSAFERAWLTELSTPFKF